LKVLITGIGITGKSTFRRLLVAKLRNFGWTTEHFDADEFKTLRDNRDADCLKGLPEKFDDKTVYIIEDIHGPLSTAIIPLKDYDLILYLKSDTFSHLMYWAERCWQWFKSGHFSWTPNKGWRGTGAKHDFQNIIPILKELLYDFKNRKKWIFEDLKAIGRFPHFIIRSTWTWRGPRFNLKL